MRSMLTFASLALPFHSRQRRRSTSLDMGQRLDLDVLTAA